MDRRNALILAGVLLLGAAAIPHTRLGGDKNLTILITAFTVASLATSWNLLGGYAGQISLGHAAFFGLGALVTRHLWLTGTPVAIAFVAGGVAAAAAAIVVGVPALRLRGIYFSIGTLALAEALRVTVSNTLPKISNLRGPQLRAYDLMPRYYLALIVLIALIGIIYWLMQSRIGLGILAVREDEDAARAVGVDVFRHKLFAFVLSALFAGLIGSSFAYFHVSYYPSYTFSPVWTFDAIIVTFVGGIGTIAGPVIGAMGFVLIRDVLARNLVSTHLLIFGVSFILVVLIAPGGLLSVLRWFDRRFIRPVVANQSQMS